MLVQFGPSAMGGGEGNRGDEEGECAIAWVYRVASLLRTSSIQVLCSKDSGATTVLRHFTCSRVCRDQHAGRERPVLLVSESDFTINSSSTLFLFLQISRNRSETAHRYPGIWTRTTMGRPCWFTADGKVLTPSRAALVLRWMMSTSPRFPLR